MLFRLPFGGLAGWCEFGVGAAGNLGAFRRDSLTSRARLRSTASRCQPKFAEFPDVKNGQTLAAEDGRAEVLLTPGVILRIAENSSFQMVSNSRSDTRPVGVDPVRRSSKSANCFHPTLLRFSTTMRISNS